MKNILLFISFLTIFLGGTLHASPSCNKLAVSYAEAISKKQFSIRNSSIKPPFFLINSQRITKSYYQESGLSPEKIADMKKYNPNDVYSVALKASNGWDCLYYVKLNTRLNVCTFSSIEFDHCAN